MIRDAFPDDSMAIDRIFNHYVTNTTLTFDLAPRSPDAGRAWLTGRSRRHPVLVWDEGGVLGWAALSPWSAKGGYDRTAEVSIFMDPQVRGRRMGTRLLGELIEKARFLGFHTLIARITVDNAASIALHHRAGFRDIGSMREVGYKEGRYLDVLICQCMLERDASGAAGLD